MKYLATMVSIAVVAAAWGTDDGLTTRGRKFAELVCSPCHVVSPDTDETPILRQPGPSFAAIAARPSTTDATLRAFLQTSHPDIGPAARMPNPRLADYEIDEVVAYILSLGPARR